MAQAIVSRTLSVHKEHEMLLKLELAGLDDVIAQAIIDSKDNELACNIVQFARAVGKFPIALDSKPSAPQPSVPEFPPVPAINEPFELEIDGDLNIAPSNWKFLGPAFPGKRTYRCRLLDLGYCSNRDDAIRKIGEQAKELKLKLSAAPGQARKAFMARYPRHNGRPIVMAGNEWQGPSRRRLVACLGDWGGGCFDPGFVCSGGGFGDFCLWLVVEQVA